MSKKKSGKMPNGSHRLMDMVTGEPGMYNTQTSVLWNDTHSYIAFIAEEPCGKRIKPSATALFFWKMTWKCSSTAAIVITSWKINAANTVYEVFFIWKDAYTNGSKFDIPSF